MKYARVVDNTVVEIFQVIPVLHPDLMAQVEQVEDNVDQRMVRQANGGFDWPEIVPPTLPEAKAAKMAQIIAGMEAFLSCRCCCYGGREEASWVSQEKEAVALIADPDAPAPLVRAAAAARGLAVPALAERILANAANWAVLQGYAVGRKGALMDILAAATTLEQVQAIEVVYTVPAGVVDVLFQA